MMSFRGLTGFILVLFVSGCMGFPPLGKIINKDDPSMTFDSDHYLVAKGYGKTKSDSVSQAKAELANIFESRISSDVTSQIKQMTDSKKGSSFTKSIESKIHVQSDIELQGVQVGEPRRWFHEFVTRAAIHKEQARDQWTHDIRTIDTKMDVLCDKAQKAKSKLQTYLPLKKSLDLWVEREAVLSRLNVIGFSSDIMSRDVRAIIEPIADIKATMLIYLDISGRNNAAVRDVVAEILNDNGFKVTDRKSNADVVIDGSVDIDKIRNNNKRFKFSRVTVSLEIIDRKTRTQAGQISETGKGQHINYDEATHVAVTRVANLVGEKVVRFFD